MNRREMIMGSLATFAATSSFGQTSSAPLKLSLAQYSLHRSLFGEAGYEKMDSLDFPKVARSLGIGAVEYVGHFFPETNPEMGFVKEMLKRSQDEGVKNMLIMVDKKGDLGDPNSAKRAKAVDNHKGWVEAAAVLNCHSIRVNARSKGKPEDQAKLLAEGMRSLCDIGDKHNINIIMENHGDLSSDGEWLASVVKLTNHPSCGTLPDFGNFWDHKTKKLLDPYAGVKAMLPFAKAVSAKTYDLVPNSDYTMFNPKYKYEIDLARMMKLTVDSGYDGYIGIEYEGADPQKNEKLGIIKSKEMIEALWEKYKA
jgi:L-ribulose-5-phosphate 3-epimerase